MRMANIFRVPGGGSLFASREWTRRDAKRNVSHKSARWLDRRSKLDALTNAGTPNPVPEDDEVTDCRLRRLRMMLTYLRYEQIGNRGDRDYRPVAVSSESVKGLK